MRVGARGQMAPGRNHGSVRPRTGRTRRRTRAPPAERAPTTNLRHSPHPKAVPLHVVHARNAFPKIPFLLQLSSRKRVSWWVHEGRKITYRSNELTEQILSTSRIAAVALPRDCTTGL